MYLKKFECSILKNYLRSNNLKANMYYNITTYRIKLPIWEITYVYFEKILKCLLFLKRSCIYIMYLCI